MNAVAANITPAMLPWRGAIAALLMWCLYIGIHWTADRIARRRPSAWLATMLGAMIATLAALSLTVLGLARAGLPAIDIVAAVALFAGLHLLTLAQHVRRAWGECDARPHHLSSANCR